MFGVCEILSIFRKVHNINKVRLFEWESHWKWLQWSHKLGGMRSQGISRAGKTVLARLMETQMWHLPVHGTTILYVVIINQNAVMLCMTEVKSLHLSFLLSDEDGSMEGSV